MRNIKNKGINLIEVIIVVAIIGIIVAVAVPQFSKIKRAQVLKNAGQDIFSTLNQARSQTLASLDLSSYGVHFQADKIVLFKGTVYSANDVNNKNINIISPATISAISLTGGATSLYFNRLSGTPSVSGTIITSVPNDNTTKVITISSIGSINLN
jgi:prepilin-type N-terminal cleavage/methylation domain-containing protein